MNTEQERADFEKWFAKSKAYISDPKDIFAQIARDIAWEAWQTRAALQSQDREDALVQAIQEAIALLGPEAPLCSGCEYEWNHALRALREAIDHARRIEGEL